MLDAKRLIDQFLGAQSTGYPATRRYGAAPASGGGILGSVARELGGRGTFGPAGTGAAMGGLASLLLRSGRGGGFAKNAVKYGGLAMIAAMAYRAWNDHQARQGQTGAAPAPQPSGADALAPPPAGSPFMPGPAEEQDRARLLLSAMIAAAKADGTIDAQEQAAILDRAADLDSEAKAFVLDQMRQPVDLDRLVAAATAPEIALEIYTASLVAIDPDHPAEQAYLRLLAARLGLDDGLVAEVDRAAEAARA